MPLPFALIVRHVTNFRHVDKRQESGGLRSISRRHPAGVETMFDCLGLEAVEEVVDLSRPEIEGTARPLENNADRLRSAPSWKAAPAP